GPPIKRGETKYPFFLLRPSIIFKEGEPAPFKIVYEGSRAALYVNGELAHEHKDLPKTGGFGLYGPSRAIVDLVIRPIKKGEHIAPDVEVAKEFTERPKPGEDATLDEPDKAVPHPPLKEYVENEWVPAGGIPEARASFRKWAA